MTRLFFLTFCGALLHFSSSSQAIRELVLPFDYAQCRALEKDVQWVIDSAYYSMQPGEKQRLVLYSKAERKKLSYEQIRDIASGRERLVNDYLRLRTTTSAKKIKRLIPFDTTAIFDTKCVGDRSQKETQPLLGIPSVVMISMESRFRHYPSLPEEAVKRKPYEITIQCDRTQEFYTNSGVMLRVEANSFVTQNGDVPPCCSITFNVEEYLTTADMLLADLSTHNYGRMLETGGMVYLAARCGDQQLRLAPGKFIYILLPQEEKKQGMLTFNGRKNQDISDWVVQSFGKVYNSPEETDKLFPQVPVLDDEGGWIDGNSETYYEGGELADGYLMKSANLGWINCDKFYEIEEKTELAVKSESEENICYRLVFKNIRSILPAYSVIPGALYKFDGLPKGEAAMLLGYWISKDRSQAYFSWKEITTGESTLETMDLKLISGGELVSLLSDLFPG